MSSAAAAPPRAPAPPQFSEPTPPGPSDPDSRFAEIDGVTVHHKRLASTQPNKPLAICFHGFGSNIFSFELCPQLRQVATLVMYDTPGFGLTLRPKSLNCYTPTFSARIAHSLAQAYNPNSEPYILIAHSLGSLAAASFCIKYPGQIRAVVLIAPALLPPSPHTPEAEPLFYKVGRWLLKALSGATRIVKPLLIPLLRALVTPKSFWRRGLSMTRTTPPPDDVVEGYRRPITAPDWEKGIINFTLAALNERARDPRSNDYMDMAAALASIGHVAPPILIVHGKNDKLVPLQNSVNLKQSLPTAKLIVLDKCGHVPHEEKPIEFTQIVNQFLNDHPLGNNRSVSSVTDPTVTDKLSSEFQ